jgi:hypothetical protein
MIFARVKAQVCMWALSIEFIDDTLQSDVLCPEQAPQKIHLIKIASKYTSVYEEMCIVEHYVVLSYVSKVNV